MKDVFEREEGNEDVWKLVLIEGHPLLLTKKRRFAMLPSDPRCKLCLAPFKGIGGWWLHHMRNIHMSKRNPLFCNACDSFLKAYPGGTTTPMTIMFVDIRDSTGLSASMPIKEYRDLVNRLRQIALSAMSRTDGSVLEFIGDGVIAVWPPGIAGEDHAAKALAAMRLILDEAKKTVFDGHDLPIGIGVHTGDAFLGTIVSVSNDLQDISAFGLDVNLAARLSDAADAGTSLVSRAAASAGGLDGMDATFKDLNLKGINGSVEAVQIS